VVDTPSRAGLGKVEQLTRGSLSRRRSERTRPYTPDERVELLLDAMTRAVVDTGELEGQVTQRLENLADTREIDFAGEPDDVQPAFRLLT